MASSLSFLLVAFLLLGATSLAVSSAAEENGEALPEEFSLRRLLHRRRRPAPLTCDRNPKICRLKGSPGRSCCRRKCVNLRADIFNCGRCGRRCRYMEACCRGKCVNVFFNRKNCGACNRRCRKKTKCVHGMCGYS